MDTFESRLDAIITEGVNLGVISDMIFKKAYVVSSVHHDEMYIDGIFFTPKEAANSINDLIEEMTSYSLFKGFNDKEKADWNEFFMSMNMNIEFVTRNVFHCKGWVYSPKYIDNSKTWFFHPKYRDDFEVMESICEILTERGMFPRNDGICISKPEDV